MKTVSFGLILFGILIFTATIGLEKWANKQFQNGANFTPIVPEYFVTGGQF